MCKVWMYFVGLDHVEKAEDVGRFRICKKWGNKILDTQTICLPDKDPY